MCVGRQPLHPFHHTPHVGYVPASFSSPSVMLDHGREGKDGDGGGGGADSTAPAAAASAAEAEEGRDGVYV